MTTTGHHAATAEVAETSSARDPRVEALQAQWTEMAKSLRRPMGRSSLLLDPWFLRLPPNDHQSPYFSNQAYEDWVTKLSALSTAELTYISGLSQMNTADIVRRQGVFVGLAGALSAFAFALFGAVCAVVRWKGGLHWPPLDHWQLSLAVLAVLMFGALGWALWIFNTSLTGRWTAFEIDHCVRAAVLQHEFRRATGATTHKR